MVIVENKGADEKVLAPAMVCAPVVITPLAVADASGILKVCAVPEEEMAKSVPVVPTAKVWVAPVSPFKLVMAAPAVVKVDIGSFLTSPLVMVKRLSAVVLVPVCTPIRVKGLVPATCRAVAGAVVPIPTLPFLSTTSNVVAEERHSVRLAVCVAEFAWTARGTLASRCACTNTPVLATPAEKEGKTAVCRSPESIIPQYAPIWRFLPPPPCQKISPPSPAIRKSPLPAVLENNSSDTVPVRRISNVSFTARGLAELVTPMPT